MSNSFSVKSLRKTYHVNFYSLSANKMEGLLQPGDYIICDSNVRTLYAERFGAIDLNRIYVVEACEEAKSFDQIAKVLESIVKSGFRKGNRLIAVGGGVIQDITAFCSTVIYRGVDWIFIPTNLLSQCDSCIGSKSSINLGTYKNLLGTFNPPSEIIIDLEFLNTLPREELYSGLGEMLHYFLIDGEDAFSCYEGKLDVALNDREVLNSLIWQSLQIKKKMIEVDEFDQGPRNIFNYGHTCGHALETATDYAIPHGIAVSYGMDLANCISVREGLLSAAFRNRARRTMAKIWEVQDWPGLDINKYFEALARDKKNVGQQVTFILSRGPGDMFKQPLDLDDELREFILTYFKEQQFRGDI